MTLSQRFDCVCVDASRSRYRVRSYTAAQVPCAVRPVPGLHTVTDVQTQPPLWSVLTEQQAHDATPPSCPPVSMLKAIRKTRKNPPVTRSVAIIRYSHSIKPETVAMGPTIFPTVCKYSHRCTTHLPMVGQWEHVSESRSLPAFIMLYVRPTCTPPENTHNIHERQRCRPVKVHSTRRSEKKRSRSRSTRHSVLLSSSRPPPTVRVVQ